jgi:tRNA threonylcarbamoyladenosine biosynthesis protein TsaB
MSESWLVIETSGRVGQLGVARGGAVVRSEKLDETRRHARDLAAIAGRLLGAEGLSPRDLTGVMVGTGPGSYTGLRVGVMSAKALAYAAGCKLVAVPTFAAIAERTPEPFDLVDVVADALQGHVYVEAFVPRRDRETGERVWESVVDLRIEPVAQWAKTVDAGVGLTGPGVAVYDAVIPSPAPRVPVEFRAPTIESVFRVGLRLPPATREELFRLEPLYLRGSSAEEKAKRDGRDP